MLKRSWRLLPNEASHKQFSFPSYQPLGSRCQPSFQPPSPKDSNSQQSVHPETRLALLESGNGHGTIATKLSAEGAQEKKTSRLNWSFVLGLERAEVRLNKKVQNFAQASFALVEQQNGYQIVNSQRLCLQKTFYNGPQPACSWPGGIERGLPSPTKLMEAILSTGTQRYIFSGVMRAIASSVVIKDGLNLSSACPPFKAGDVCDLFMSKSVPRDIVSNPSLAIAENKASNAVIQRTKRRRQMIQLRKTSDLDRLPLTGRGSEASFASRPSMKALLQRREWGNLRQADRLSYELKNQAFRGGYLLIEGRATTRRFSTCVRKLGSWYEQETFMLPMSQLLSSKKLKQRPVIQMPSGELQLPNKEQETGNRGTPNRYIWLKPNPPQSETIGSSTSWGRVVQMDREWLTAFATINAMHRQKIPPPQEIIPGFVLSFSRFVEQEAIHSNGPHTIGHVQQIWATKTPQWKREWWRSALLYALWMSPKDALHIANDLCTKPILSVPSHVIQDVLDDVATTELENVEKPEIETVDLIVDSACLFLDSHFRHTSHAFLGQWTIRTLSKHLNVIQLDKLRGAMDGTGSLMKTHTKTHMIKKYVALDRLGPALELLQSMPSNELRWDAVQSMCAIILRTPWHVEDLYGLQCKILAFLLELGLSPNRRLHNAILVNAMEAGDRELAWQSYHVTRRNGLSPDAYTYSVLLKGVECGDGLDAIDAVYTEARSNGILADSPFLARHILDAIYTYFTSRKSPAFNTMLAFYSKMFDTTPLRDLGIIEQDPSLEEQAPMRMVPTDRAVAWLIIAYLKDNASRPILLHELYDRYLHHVSDNHPVIAPLASESFIATAFILAFGQNRSSLRMCTTVAQDMLKPSKLSKETTVSDPIATITYSDSGVHSTPGGTDPELSSSGLTDSSPVRSPSPSTSSSLQRPLVGFRAATPLPQPLHIPITPTHHVWNALLLVFSRHKQLNAAERILSLMRSHGVAPDQMSWNHLIGGYVRKQDMAGLVDTVKRMGNENFRPDEWVLQRLSRVYDRGALLRGLEEAAMEERKRQAEGEKEEAMGGEAEWESTWNGSER